ncbi:MAG: branched-chain amino acid ABC transporter permease [Synergistaceae bacterium]|jgi:branched-chain amino acid transport system permease protein|nr:branched-chain amino acid ABC transporter permease [Synergistaceae bacterium]
MKAEKASFDNNSGIFAVIGPVVVIVLLLIPQLSSNFTVFLFTRILITSLISMSLILLAGYGGLLSFAQVSFYGITAYGIGIMVMRKGFSFGPAILIAILISLVIGVLFALIAVRTKGNYFIMMTLSFGQLVYLCALQWVELTGGFNGITGIPPITIFNYALSGNLRVYYLSMAVLVVCYLLLKRIVSSPFGLALQGARDNEKKMAALGFNVFLIKYYAFIIAIFFASLGGVLAVAFYGQVSPNIVTLSASVMILFVALIGCITKFEGAVVGSAIYVLLEDLFSLYTERYVMIIGIFFILVVLFMPRGILGIKLKK